VPKPGRADITSANLTPASGRQDRTTSPSTATSFVSAPFDRSQILIEPALHHVGDAIDFVDLIGQQNALGSRSALESWAEGKGGVVQQVDLTYPSERHLERGQLECRCSE
jgi:hypothetical protein